MKYHSKVFLEENSKLDRAINNYIHSYKWNYYINLIPTKTTVIRNIEHNNYMMSPNRVEVLIYFEEHEISNEEKEIIEEDKDRELEFNIRKNKVTGDLMFWFIDDYYDLHNIFYIHINNEFKRVILEFPVCFTPPKIFEEYIKTRHEWTIFISKLELKIEKVLFG